MLTADDTLSLDARLAEPIDTRQRAFWIALGVALLVHAAFIVEVSRSREHLQDGLGIQGGADNAIAVEIVTDADLKSLTSTGGEAGGGAPVLKPTVEPKEAEPEQVPPPEAPPAPEAKAEPVPEPKADPAPAKVNTPEPAPAEPKATAETKPEASPTPTVPDFETLAPEFAEPTPPPAAKEPPPPEAKKAEPAEKQAKPETAQKAQPREAPKKKQQQAKLDLSPPPGMPNKPTPGSGRAPTATRPPGITRSGENDRFGLGVLRALVQTVPRLTDITGRVTVRFVLNENGDVAEVSVLESSGKPLLDQSTVFAIKQTYFPLPPRASKAVDREFFIRYNFRYEN